MSDTKEQCILPAELILRILHHTNLRDIIRWRTVSKWFRALTHDRTIWTTLYVNAPFARPPGPFLFQSATSLERALVRSAQLAQSWTTQGIRSMPRVEIPFDGRNARSFDLDLIGGRWFIVCQSNQRIVLYDTNANPERGVPQVLWEQEQIDSWTEFSMASKEGQWIVYTLLADKYCQWKIIEFRLDGESGALCDTVAVDVPASYRVTQMVGGLSPFVFLRPSLFFDTRTHLFYEYPELLVALDETRSKVNFDIDREVIAGGDNILTNTHIFVYATLSRRGVTFIQAFTVPDNQPIAESGAGTLHLSHEGLMHEIRLQIVIRNSVVDPVTGSISLKFLCKWIDHDGLHPKCLDMTLHKPSSVDSEVSPITIHRQAVITKDDGPLHENIRFNHSKYNVLDSLGDGYARGLFTVYHYYPDGADDYPLGQTAILKFMIDATQDSCVATLSEYLRPPAEWQDLGCRTRGGLTGSYLNIDSIRGSAWGALPGEEKQWILVLMDIQ